MSSIKTSGHMWLLNIWDVIGLTGVLLCAYDACGTLESMKKNVKYAVYDF